MAQARFLLLACLLAGGLVPIAYGQTGLKSANEGPPTIDAIRFEGLNRTRPDFLRRFLGSRPGRPYDSIQVATDVQALRNISTLGDASAELRTLDPDRHVLVFEVTEYASRIPCLNVGGISENVWFQIGGIDTNWLGQGYGLGGYYRYDGGHSFGLYQSMPYLFGGRWGLSYTLDRLATTEPAFFGRQTVSYEVRRFSGIGLLRYELVEPPGAGLTSAIEAGGGVLREAYRKASRGESPGPAERTFWKYLLKVRLTQRDVNHYRHERAGVVNITKLQAVKTGGGPFNFWKVLNVFRGYARPFPNANWALRLRTGISTNERSPFVHFVLDNYVNVRGVGNVVARGTAELTLNAEHRQTLLETPDLVVQGVGFADVSAWRPGGAPLTDLFVPDNVVSFGGAGLRLNVRYRYNITIRADYGVNLFDPARHGPVIGIGQYF